MSFHTIFKSARASGLFLLVLLFALQCQPLFGEEVLLAEYSEPAEDDEEFEHFFMCSNNVNQPDPPVSYTFCLGYGPSGYEDWPFDPLVYPHLESRIGCREAFVGESTDVSREYTQENAPQFSTFSQLLTNGVYDKISRCKYTMEEDGLGSHGTCSSTNIPALDIDSDPDLVCSSITRIRLIINNAFLSQEGDLKCFYWNIKWEIWGELHKDCILFQDGFE